MAVDINSQPFGLEKDMAEVDKCPQNLTGVNEASRKLGCGMDQFGNNQYLCLPNVEKTSLVEFCFKGTMGLFEKGHCVQTFRGKLTFKSCLQFSSGCPENVFRSTEFYKYPACQDLNVKYNCYTFDPHCPPQVNENTNNGPIIAGVIVGLIAFLTMSISVYLLWKRMRNRKGRKAQEKQDEEHSLSPAARIDSKTQEKQDEEQPLFVARIEDREQKILDKDEELLSTDKTGEKEQKSHDNEGLFATDKTVSSAEWCVTYYHEEIRLVLFGKTGCGKSATGNTILGSKKFKSLFSVKSVTKTCSSCSVIRFNKKIVVVDTPGIFNTEETSETIQNEMLRCMAISSPGPHAFIMVLNLAVRFTEEEERIIAYLEQQFGEKMYKYLIILFTREDEMNRNNVKFSHHIENCPSMLKSFVAKCDGRVITFDNTRQDDGQVQALLTLILQNIKNNGGQYYSNEIYRKTEEQIQNLEIEIRMDEEKQKKELDKINEEIEAKYQKGKTERDDELLRLQTQTCEYDKKKNLNDKIEGMEGNAHHEHSKELKEKEQVCQAYSKPLDKEVTREQIRTAMAQMSTLSELGNGIANFGSGIYSFLYPLQNMH